MDFAAQPQGGAGRPAHPLDMNNLMSFDLETTGLDVTTARIVTGALLFLPTQNRTLTWLADPGVEIPAASTQVHGITTEKARAEGRPHDEVVREIIAEIRAGWDNGATLIVYNAPYDLSILRALDPTFTIDGLVIDPLVIARHQRGRGSKNKLEDICAAHNVRLDDAHNANADALAAARVAWKMLRSTPELTNATPDDMMVAQSLWHYEWASGLNSYFASKGRPADVDLGWPLQSRVVS